MVPILSYLCVCVWQFHRVCFLFSLIVSCYQIWDFRFLIVILNFLIESWFFLKSKVESVFWLNIIHVWLCLASCFVFCFFCASEFPFLIWYAHNVKKKGLPEAFPIETWHSASLVYKKKKKKFALKKIESVSLYSLLFMSISYWVFFSCVSFVFRICNCLRLIRSWLGFRFWVI